MRHLNATEIAARLPFGKLIAALKDAASQSITAPPRQIVQINGNSKLLLMPAFSYQSRMGVKIISVFDDNKHKPCETIQGVYCLFDSDNGMPLATLDGAELTARRTAAASVLTADILAEKDTKAIVICGDGKLLPYFIEAYSTIRPGAAFHLWARNYRRLKSREQSLGQYTPQPITIFKNLEDALFDAQIISTITSANKPIVQGPWLRPGMHLDLVGAHTRSMAEADPHCFSRAKIFVDSKEAALEEAGDLIAAIGADAIEEKDILGDVFELASGRAIFERASSDITLFKSVGHAFEDLAAATLATQQG